MVEKEHSFLGESKARSALEWPFFADDGAKTSYLKGTMLDKSQACNNTPCPHDQNLLWGYGWGCCLGIPGGTFLVFCKPRKTCGSTVLRVQKRKEKGPLLPLPVFSQYYLLSSPDTLAVPEQRPQTFEGKGAVH